MVLRHLLRELAPQDYCLISQKNYNYYHIQGNFSERLPGRIHFLRPEYQISRTVLKAASTFNLASAADRLLSWRERQIEQIVKREGCDTIVACTGNVLDPIAAYRVSTRLGLPFVFYVFDDIASTWTPPILTRIVNDYVPVLLKGADRVIVPNEILAEKYRETYQIEPDVLHNPCDLSPYRDPVRSISSDEIRIVYTGAIYEAHFDAVRNLVEGLKALDRPEVSLHLYTPQSSRRLEAHGIAGPVVVHRPQPVATMPSIQMGADILFLPLGFRTPYPETIRTSAPGKIGEYLASSTPILVHAPADSFLSWYFRTHRCGMVVDQPDPVLLAQSVGTLLSDRNLREEYSANALNRCREDFDVQNVAQTFRSLVCPTSP